jgi:hypothetical protein
VKKYTLFITQKLISKELKMKSFQAKLVLSLLLTALLVLLVTSCISFGDPKYSTTKGKTVITIFEATTESYTPEFNLITVTFKVKYLEYSSVTLTAQLLDTNGKKYPDIGKNADKEAVIDGITNGTLAAVPVKYNFYEKDITDGVVNFVMPNTEKPVSILFVNIGQVDISGLVKSK